MESDTQSRFTKMALALSLALMVGSATNGEPSSLLSMLSPEEIHRGMLGDVSWHRAADPTPAPEQVLPRRIMQTGRTFAYALSNHAHWMRAWWDMNPEYEYSFFGDVHAMRFVRAHASPRELRAFLSVQTGSQRADLFRVLYMRKMGGVYADIDQELRAPLAGAVPPAATALVGRFWPFEFLVFTPEHPVLTEAAHQMTENILQQVEWQRTNSTLRCTGSHQCVIMVTGPLAWSSSVGAATQAGGCRNKGRMVSWKDCKHARLAALQDMRICTEDENDAYNTWSCNISRHWVRAAVSHAQSDEACVRASSPRASVHRRTAATRTSIFCRRDSGGAATRGITTHTRRHTSTCSEPRARSVNGVVMLGFPHLPRGSTNLTATGVRGTEILLLTLDQMSGGIRCLRESRAR